MSYSLLEWVEIWQIFITRRLELLKTHHLIWPLYNKQDLLLLIALKPFEFPPCMDYTYLNNKRLT